ncbi:hypothetical protein AVEN_49146-1 [Araneus ventricosus]|uniref:RNase H type-1 domain-containing protein n=1 Tax=Araneus ventricosus TaxID=182803 RepID=A0A4Y2BZQ8_ARAVE|nr:hypothetical protein AVEN_49146-1 [Araneus ventricosus]
MAKWSDIESSLKAARSFSTTSPIAQQIQTILLSHPSIKLGWIKAHVDHKGNEAADALAKQVTSVGSPFNIQLQEASSKNLTAADMGKWAIHSITAPAAHSPLLFTSPNPPRISKQSGGIVMKNRLFRIKTRNLENFLLDNESLLSPDPDSE